MPGEIVFYILGAILLILIIAYICFYKQVNLFVVAVSGKKRIQKNLYKECKVNDFLIINDIWLPVSENKIRHIDTIIFGNKYIYICKIVKQAGEVKIALDDQKWRVIYHGQLTLIDNPFLYNRKIVTALSNVVEGLEEKDMKSLVILTKTCDFNSVSGSNNEFIVCEKEAIKLILDIEKNSDEDVFDPYEIERYAKAFYEQGLKSEEIRKQK